MCHIDKLVEVDVRELWRHEQYDFSKWLCEETNIEYLNEILGLTLVDVNAEVYVGPYRCDIVAVDEFSGDKVIVENQLETTNHDHLGKIITYASGLGAKVIVWIVKQAKEEHRAAVEWLNNNTSTEINFFLIEIHAYKIGDSNPAPKFEVLEKPNDFAKRYKTKSNGEELNRSQSERLLFWEQFNQVLVSRGKPFNPRKAQTTYWYDVAIGSSDAYISIYLVNKDNSVCLNFYIPDNKNLFDSLFVHRKEIENELGFDMEWDRLNGKKASRIKHNIEGLNFDDHSNYNELIDEIITKTVKLKNVFSNYI